MQNKNDKNIFILIALIIAGIVIGGIIGEYLGSKKGLEVLGDQIQLINFKDFSIDLIMLKIKLSLSLGINIPSALGIFAAVLIYRKV